ncbi:hypothetical protein HaLaN_12255, partial [Haematococcus lacustris]
EDVDLWHVPSSSVAQLSAVTRVDNAWQAAYAPHLRWGGKSGPPNSDVLAWWLRSAGHPQDIAQYRRALGALRIGKCT